MELNQRLAHNLRGLGVGLCLPDPAQWLAWHSNVKTASRPSGTAYCHVGLRFSRVLAWRFK